MPPRYRTPAASSSPCNAIFSSKGEMMPPWGVPSPVGANPFPASKIPAFSHPAIIPLAGKPPSISSRRSWLILSNVAARSASRIHTRADFPEAGAWVDCPGGAGLAEFAFPFGEPSAQLLGGVGGGGGRGVMDARPPVLPQDNPAESCYQVLPALAVLPGLEAGPRPVTG